MSLRSDTRVLAHDSLAGRGTGTEGSRSAARYIAERLQSIGLDPIHGDASRPDGYLDSVPLLRVDVSAATLTIAGSPVTHGNGFVVGRVGRDGLRAVSAPVAQLADSADAPSGHWLLIDRSLGEAAMRWLPIWKERGVVGILVRLGAESAVTAYHEQLGDVRWQLRDGPADPIWQPDLPVLMIGPAVAAAMSGGARVDFDPNAAIDSVVDFNVVGVLRSSANEARDHVVLSAHYDHLGTVHGVQGDNVYNGFSDNAAGVAMLLAIAQSAVDAPPERPLLFLFTAAEEVGLLGSIHFVRAHPDVVAGTHALVNLDAGAPPAPPTKWRLAAGTRSWAGSVATRVVEAHGWGHRSDPGSPNSDHWPFVALGVPAVFLIPDGAYENTSAAEEEQLRARWDRYHHPDDEWSADFPFTGLARYALLGREIVYALAATERGAE